MPLDQPLVESAGALAPLVLAVLAIGVLLWTGLRSRGRRLLISALLAFAFLAPLATLPLASPERLGPEWRAQAAESYEGLWQELDQASLKAALELESLDLAEVAPLDVFAGLEGLAEAEGPSLLLLDPEGRVAAWGGSGLLHPLEHASIPSTGPAFYSSFSAVTMASVRRVGRQDAAWRLVAARSLSSRRLPFRAPGGESRSDFVWAVVKQGARLPEGASVISAEGRPSMSLLPVAGSGGRTGPRATALLRAAWLVLGIAMLLLAVPVAQRQRGSRGVLLASLLQAVGATLIGVAFLLPYLHAALLFAGLFVGLTSWANRAQLRPSVWWPLLPLGAVGIITLLAFRLEKLLGPLDLASTLDLYPAAASLRLVGLAVASAGLLPVVGTLVGRDETRDRDRPAAWPWTLGAGVVLTGVLLAGQTVLTLPLLAAGVLLLVQGLRSMGSVETPARRLLVFTMAALIAASTWEVAYRSLVGRFLEKDIVPILGPPTEEEQDAIRDRISGYLEGVDLLDLAPADPVELDEFDLAYTLWLRSPLFNQGALSALAVVMDGVPVSRFEYGVPLNIDGMPDLSPELWQELAVPGWEGALIDGESELRYLDAPIGVVRWSYLARPGFRMAQQPIDNLAARLVQGRLSSDLPIHAQVTPGSFAVYDRGGPPLLAPRGTPSLSVDLLNQPSFSASLDERRYTGWTHPTGDATEVILLRDPRPLHLLERIGVQALSTLSALGVLMMVMAMASGYGPRSLIEGLQGAYRSYSKKLLLVYGVMLLLPLLLLTVALLGVLGQRLDRSQTVASEAAMEAAQHVLGEYVLSLDPGFGVDTALDDTLLGWLSRVIHHQVNLYWGSTLYASSNPALFAAGLLPERIPGEVYAQLRLQAATQVERSNQASGERYVELYAPVRIPGSPSQETLFLSIPLLAQQQQTSSEIALLRTRAVLVACLLMLVVVSIGTRLSHNFTRPLRKLVRGTEAIAQGATSIEQDATELELVALVSAINDMAAKIATAREGLVREKQVMEKMIQNITAAIVSLDVDRRVLLLNKVAGETLGLRVGDSLEEALGRNEALAPLSTLLEQEDGGSSRQHTLRIFDEEGAEQEWSVVWLPLPGEGEPTALLVVEDVSEVLRSERLEAWAEMARMIAHEIKNPLTPIRLSTEHMVEVHASNPQAFEEVFERCSSNILEQVDELHQIASEFSTYSRIPQVQTETDDLVAALRELVESYIAAPPPGIEIRLTTAEAELICRFDRKLLLRALRNLMENAIRATSAGGTVEMALKVMDEEIEISVTDSGTGVSDSALGRIFEPYFSTDASGTGLGLPISRRILEEHGGTLTAHHAEEGGLRVVARLPNSATASSDSPAP
jgi:signal transduction histidine kinase